MKLNFTPSLDRVFASEGGYVDNPKDPGGATNMGITRKTLAAWRKITPYTALPKSEVQALTKTEAGAIYKAGYWDVVCGDSLPAGLDYAVLDFAVLSGPFRAAATLQECLGVAQDGQIGPLTIAAANAANLKTLIDTYSSKRLTFLRSLSGFPTFGKGWSTRVASVRAAALDMTAKQPAKPNPFPPLPKPPPVPATPPMPKPNWLALVIAFILAIFKGNRK